MFDMRFCNLILLLPCLSIVTVARAQSRPTEAEALFAHKVWPLINGELEAAEHPRPKSLIGEMNSAMSSGERYYVQSPFEFGKFGQSWADLAKNWAHLSGLADDIFFFRGWQVDSVNHPTAQCPDEHRQPFRS